MHLDEATLERALHGELDAADRAAVERHLAACAECGARLAAAEREERRLFGLFEALDHDPPPLDWEAVRTAPPRPEIEPARSRARIAAGLALLLVGAAALAAFPGAPVREWLSSALRDGAAPIGSSSPEEPPTRSGIAVPPGDPFTVAFTHTQRTGRIRIAFSESADVELVVEGAPVGLESSSERLVVSNAGSVADYELRVPRSLQTIRVTIAGEPVLERRDGAIRGSATRDAAGGYVIDLEGVSDR